MTEPSDGTASTAAPAPAPEVPTSNPTGLRARPRRSQWLVPAITGISGLILGVAAGGVGFKVIDDMTVKAAEVRTAAAAEEALEDQKDTLRSAVRRCISSGNESFAVLADRRTTLTLEQKGKDDYLGGISATELWCVIDRLDAPAAVVSHMEQTTSLDGRQTEGWDGFEASWSYHPDRGMDTVITIVSD